MGSIDMPRVMVGLGSVNDVACAFPFKANIAEGFLYESLSHQFGDLLSNTRQVIGTVFLAIGSEL